MAYTWPVPVNAPITQYFGTNAYSPVQPMGHTGMDIAPPLGTAIHSIGDGTVLYANWANKLSASNKWYIAPAYAGIVTLIDHGHIISVYAHMNTATMNAGQRVKQGQKIGTVGSTGLSTGPHLHFEIIPTPIPATVNWLAGREDPLNYVKKVAFAGGDDVEVILKHNQRRVGNSNLNQRAEPNTNSKVIRVIKANTVEEFTAYVDGERIKGNNNWFMDSKGFVWSGGFDSSAVKGLPKEFLKPDLKANQRKVGNANVNQRNHATTDSKVIRLIKANTIETFTGFVYGEKIKDNNVWFADAKGYVWSGAFDDTSTKGLDNLTKKQLAPNERLVGNANVNHRNKPNNNSKVIRLIKANTVEKFIGYVHGEKISGNDIWFKDAEGYAWSGAFEDSSTKGLENLTPKEPEKDEPNPDLASNKRKVGSVALNQRVQPTTESVVIRVIDPNTYEVFTGYVHGQDIDGNDIWFKDAKGFAWSGGFVDSSTDGLKNQTDSLDELPSINGPYEFEPDFGIAEYFPAHTTNMQHGHFPDKPTHVVLHQFNAKELHPSIEGVISHFQTVRPGSESSAHFAVSRDRIVQMVSLHDRAFHAGAVGNDYIGIEIDPQEDTATVDSVKTLLSAIRDKYGYLPIYIEHQDVPGNATSCGIDIHLSKYTLSKDSEPKPKPEPEPEPEPEVPSVDQPETVVAKLDTIIDILQRKL